MKFVAVAAVTVAVVFLLMGKDDIRRFVRMREM